MFGLGVTAEVFGCDRSAEGLACYDYAVATAEPGVIRTDVGLPILVEAGLDRFSAADLGIVVCWDQPDVLPLSRRSRRCAPWPGAAAGCSASAQVRSCSRLPGCWTAAGLLDGRRATTHWRYAAQLASRYPAIDVDPGVLYVDDGQVITSGGTAAGIDACLHLLRLEYGAAVANAVARRMVVPRTGTAARRSSCGCASVRRTTRRTWRPCTSGPLDAAPALLPHVRHHAAGLPPDLQPGRTRPQPGPGVPRQ